METETTVAVAVEVTTEDDVVAGDVGVTAAAAAPLCEAADEMGSRRDSNPSRCSSTRVSVARQLPPDRGARQRSGLPDSFRGRVDELTTM
jgi:hypothetical protein